MAPFIKVKLTVADCTPGDVPKMVGGDGMSKILADAADDGEVPTTSMALTVNVYELPLVRPVTIIGEFVPVAV